MVCGTGYDLWLSTCACYTWIWIICSSQEINGDEKEVAVGIAVCTLAETNYPDLGTHLKVFVKVIMWKEYF